MRLEDALSRYEGAVAFRFGDGAALNRRILDLVLAGQKTVSCDARAAFEARGEALPVAGRVDVACDWGWGPVAALRTLSVEEIPFEEMGAELIADQAEFADLEDWRRGYRAYIDRSVGFRPGMAMVVERFAIEEVF